MSLAKPVQLALDLIPEDKQRQFGKFRDVMFTVPPAAAGAGALGALLGEDNGI